MTHLKWVCYTTPYYKRTCCVVILSQLLGGGKFALLAGGATVIPVRPQHGDLSAAGQD